MSNEISNQQVSSDDNSRADFLSSFEEKQVSIEDPESSQQSTEQVNGSEEIKQLQFEIDDKFKDLPREEATLRTIQSRYDKLYKIHEQMLREKEENSKLVEFLTELEEDDTILEAYLNERKPELISKRDISTIVKEKLTEEFPEFAELRPTRQDADDDPGGRAWLYFRRLDELYADLKGQSGKTKTVKEIREEHKQVKMQQDAEIHRQLQDVQTKMNWEDNALQSFIQWANKASLYDLAKMYKFGLNTMRINSVTTIPGQQPTQKTARQSFLERL